MAPLPPKVANEPFVRCEPEAQNAFERKSIVVALREPMSLATSHASAPGRAPAGGSPRTTRRPKRDGR
jgi:hypothetical protein